MTDTFFSSRFDFSGRDFACFVFAAAVHSMLLLWQGGVLELPNKAGDLGDMLVEVNFMAEVPDFDAPGGGGPAKPQTFLARVKSMIKGQGPKAEKTDLAMGSTPAPVEAPKPSWTKTESLTNKVFADKKGFQGMGQNDSLDIAKGQVQEVKVQTSQGNFKKAQPNLKENTFKIAPKDAPFTISSPKNTDALSNVNAVPVVVGRTTTPSIKSLDGGPGDGPALQSKTFASKGASTSKGFGSGASMSKSDSGSGLLAMGQGSSAISAPAGSLGQGGSATTGSGYGQGGGTGSGSGSGNGRGTGGRTWGSGSGTMGRGSMTALPRNTVSADSGPAGAKAVNDSKFNITGALANRPISQKSFAKYESDARVALRFRVDWSGKVLDGILVEISSGSPTFDQKVIASLKEWLFSRLPAGRTNEIQEGVITFVFKGV